MKRLTVLCAALATIFISCNSDPNKKYLPDSVGAINTLAVVIDSDMWNGEVGDSIRKHFAAPVLGLPWDEPLFTMHQIPPSVFTGFARNSRNILYVGKDSVNVSGISSDLYAKPQKIALIKGQDTGAILSELSNHSDSIISVFKNHDITENQHRFTRSLNKEKDLSEKLGISLTMPSIYKIVKQENNFFWIERQIEKGTMNILVYEMPLNSIPSDTSRVDAIIKMRDSIGKQYIPGREEGMYMITEKAYAPYVKDVNLNGHEAIETKGMWEVKNFFMAGPFVNYIVKDQHNDRLLVIEGFTFAPSTNKRDYMFELEAILKTLRIAKESSTADSSDS